MVFPWHRENVAVRGHVPCIPCAVQTCVERDMICTASHRISPSRALHLSRYHETSSWHIEQDPMHIYSCIGLSASRHPTCRSSAVHKAQEGAESAGDNELAACTPQSLNPSLPEPACEPDNQCGWRPRSQMHMAAMPDCCALLQSCCHPTMGPVCAPRKSH